MERQSGKMHKSIIIVSNFVVLSSQIRQKNDSSSTETTLFSAFEILEPDSN